MTKIKSGDIVEVILSKENQSSIWNGLRIRLEEVSSEGITGEVLIVPFSGEIDKYQIGSTIKWYSPEKLTLVTASQNSKKEQYLSPFSGRWV